MRIQESNMSQKFNPAIEQPKDRLTALQKRVTLVDKQIEKIKENDKLSAEEKKAKVEALEQSKEELRVLIEEEQINKKINELDDKMAEAESSKVNDDQPITPQDEIEAELGLNEIQADMMFGISKHFDRAEQKLSIARNLRAEAKIQQKEIETDRGRGQSIGVKDYKVQQMISNRTTADRVEQSAFKDNGKVIKAIDKADKSTKEVKEKNEDVKSKVEKEDEKKITSGKEVGSHVDVKL